MSAPDPSDFGAILSAAVAAHCARTGDSKAAVARLAGIARGNFTTALRNPNARPATMRAVCRALGLKVVLVPAGPDA
jgi:DNA-binding phage protein